MAGRPHQPLATVRRRQTFRRGWRFRVFTGSGGSRVRGGAAEEGVDLSETSDASEAHSEVCLKLGHSCLNGEALVFRCRWLRITRGAGPVRGIILKLVLR